MCIAFIGFILCFQDCMTGPVGHSVGGLQECRIFDADKDGDIDLFDYHVRLDYGTKSN